jgi:signal peptidase I
MKNQTYEAKLIKRGTYGLRLGKRKVATAARSIVLYGLICILCIIYFSISVMLNNPTKSLLGYKMEIVKTGSMEPNIPVHSLVVINKKESYQMNDIINFIYKDESYTHRIVAIGDGIYKTKGDANNIADLEVINKSSIVGKVIYHSKQLGSAIVYVRNLSFKWFFAGSVTIFFLCILLYSIFSKDNYDFALIEKNKANKKAIRAYKSYQRKFILCLKLGIKPPKRGNYDITL